MIFFFFAMNTVHCTPYDFTKCYTYITSHTKHPKFACVALKIYMAKLTLLYLKGDIFFNREAVNAILNT